MIKLSAITSQFELSPTLAANELAQARRKRGLDVLHMGFGESPFPVPARLNKALQDNAGLKQYLPTAGLPELQEAVAKYYRENTDLDTDAYDVIVAPGSKLILYALQMAVEGDLLMPVPSWVSYAPQAHMLHTGIVKVPTTLNDEGYHICPQALKNTITQAREAGQNPSKIILNYPNNPTGLTFTEDNLKEIAEVCVAEDVLIISDEIYGFVNFTGEPYRSIAKYAPTHTAITTGLSKHLSLGGWRVGVGFIPKAVSGLHKMLCTIASETWSCVPAPIQQASVEAYKNHKDIEEHIAACSAVHEHMNCYIGKKLRQSGISVPQPQGAFYSYPNFDEQRSALNKLGVTTSTELAAYLGEHYGLIALPGAAFGEDANSLTLRLSGCDYDGTTALKAYQDGTTLDDTFVKTYAPRVVEALAAFDNFSQKIKQAAA